MLAKRYIAVIYDDVTQQKLQDWAVASGFDLAHDYDDIPIDPKDFEFHTTIFYTSNEVKLIDSEPGYKLIESHTVNPIGFESLGEEKDIPVLKVDSSGALGTLRKRYENAGYQDKWDDYIPHVSLSYVRKPVDFTNIQLPAFPLTFNYVKVKELKE